MSSYVSCVLGAKRSGERENASGSIVNKAGAFCIALMCVCVCVVSGSEESHPREADLDSTRFEG